MLDCMCFILLIIKHILLQVLEVGTSCEYAVKCVYLATDQELAQGYINEVRLLRELQNSDRVIRLFD